VAGGEGFHGWHFDRFARTLRPGARQVERLSVVAAATIPAVLYLLYVAHYSVDVPYADDWNMVPVVVLALHGKLGIGELWSQYGDTRLLIPRLCFVLIGWIDHFDIRTVLLLSATMFIASYILILPLLRRYTGKPLTSLSVLAVGVAWFSLADVQNALWSFQLAWYAATFFFVAMIFFLLSPRHRVAMYGLGIGAAVAGSYAIVQGFVLWPVGLICLLLGSSRGRRTVAEVTVWLSAAAITAAIYLHRFDTTSTAGGGVSHPVRLARFVILLIGNVIPTAAHAAHPNFVFHEVLGTIVAGAAAFVVVQSIRERHTRNPLPVLLITYGLFFDVMISLGRYTQGPSGALNNNRYTMPNLVLLTGVVIFGCAHPPSFNKRAFSRLALGAMVGLLAAQCVATTAFGVAVARTTHQTYETDARLVVNLDRVPMAQQGCDSAYAVDPPHGPTLAREIVAIYGRLHMARDKLSVFQPATFRRYRAQGPPNQHAIKAASDFAAIPDLWVGKVLLQDGC
jgi:hypothetical protein